MLPVLHARESIHAINEMAYATGNTEKDSGMRFMRELGHLAQGPNAKQQRAHRPASMEEMQRLFAGTGTAVVSE